MMPSRRLARNAELLQAIAQRRATAAEAILKRYNSTRRIRQIIHEYALAAGIQKRVYPHLFRHQIITFLIKKGIISPKLQ
jgi:site-specific recombinase XerD